MLAAVNRTQRPILVALILSLLFIQTGAATVGCGDGPGDATGAPPLDHSPMGTISFVKASNGLPLGGGWKCDPAIGDVNGDGHQDITAITRLGNGPKVYLQNGNLVWRDASKGLPDRSTGGGMDLGDVDGDGDLDLAVGDHGANPRVYRGDGTGTWDGPFGRVNTSLTSDDIELGDINNDGHLDIVHCDRLSHPSIQAYLGDGKGNWTPASNGLPYDTLGGGGYTIRLGDVNNDGYLDIACPLSTDDHRIFLGDGTGNWTAANSGLNMGAQYWGVDLGDVDNDGDLDLALGGWNGDSVAVYKNNGHGNWTRASSGLPSLIVAGVEFSDLDQDGNLDLVAMGYNTGKTHVFRGNGAGSWTEVTSGMPAAQSWDAIGVGTGDLDHNGYPDLVLCFGQDSQEGGALEVWKNSQAIPGNLSVQVMEPRPLSRHRPGSLRLITWNTVGGRTPSSMDISYSTTGPKGPWMTIASNVANSGRYQWIVPDTVTRNCYVRVYAHHPTDPAKDAYGVSRDRFEIFDDERRGVWLDLASPVGGEMFYLGDPVRVNWTVQDGTYPLDIQVYYGANGTEGNVTLVGTETMGSGGKGNLTFFLPEDEPTHQGYLEVVATDSAPVPSSFIDGTDGTFFVAERLDRLELQQGDLDMEIGETATFDVRAWSPEREITHLLAFKWSMGGTSCQINATSGTSVQVTALLPGEAVLRVSAGYFGNTLSDGANVTVMNQVRDLEVTPTQLTLEHGGSARIVARAVDVLSRDITSETAFTWSVDGDVVSLDTDTGPAVNVTGTGVGQGWVNVSAVYRSGTLHRSVQVGVYRTIGSVRLVPKDAEVEKGGTLEMTAISMSTDHMPITEGVYYEYEVMGDAGFLDPPRASASPVFHATGLGGVTILVRATYRDVQVTDSTVVTVIPADIPEGVVIHLPGSLDPEWVPVGEPFDVYASVHGKGDKDLTPRARFDWSIEPDIASLTVIGHNGTRVVPETLGNVELRVTATVEGFSVSSFVNLTFVRAIDDVELLRDPGTGPVHQGDTVLLTLVLLDWLGEPILEGAEVEWSTGSGDLGPTGDPNKVEWVVTEVGTHSVTVEYTLGPQRGNATATVEVLRTLLEIQLGDVPDAAFVGDVISVLVTVIDHDGNDVTGMVEVRLQVVDGSDVSVDWEWDVGGVMNITLLTWGDLTFYIVADLEGSTVQAGTSLTVTMASDGPPDGDDDDGFYSTLGMAVIAVVIIAVLVVVALAVTGGRDTPSPSLQRTGPDEGGEPVQDASEPADDGMDGPG